jgi:hypothetical protein
MSTPPPQNQQDAVLEVLIIKVQCTRSSCGLEAWTDYSKPRPEKEQNFVCPVCRADCVTVGEPVPKPSNLQQAFAPDVSMARVFISNALRAKAENNLSGKNEGCE